MGTKVTMRSDKAKNIDKVASVFGRNIFKPCERVYFKNRQSALNVERFFHEIKKDSLKLQNTDKFTRGLTIDCDLKTKWVIMDFLNSLGDTLLLEDHDEHNDY